ncbi:hypothetical protein CEXT_362471 [Caerostris extrusa]|uniref:Uncharacterized protein n=1 Tax=Caerostris extrusa TaxID=172846 RepID=A0AAV4VE08_CAEEX|nr:hypothetical protein CEXT_362471 [Caerostris extrusa]
MLAYAFSNLSGLMENRIHWAHQRGAMTHFPFKYDEWMVLEIECLDESNNSFFSKVVSMILGFELGLCPNELFNIGKDYFLNFHSEM